MGNQGILASATEYMKETAESVGDYFTNSTEVAKHKAKEETYRAERKVDTEQAKNNDASITDRLDSGVDAAIDGAKELAEGAQKEYAELKSDNASSDSNQGILSSIGGFFSSSAKEAEHKAKLETEQAKNNNADLTDRFQSGVDAAIDGAKELAEGAQQNKQEIKNDVSMLY